MGRRKCKQKKLGKKPEKKLILLFVEGRKTELLYFQKIASKYENTRMIVKHTNDKMVEENYIYSIQSFIKKQPAIQKKDFSFIGIVFDKDKKEDNTFNKVIKEMENKGFVPLWSNPCFELWFILHYTQWQGTHECNEIITNLDKKVKKDHSAFYGYDKTKEEILEYFADLIEERTKAIKHAKKLIAGNKLPSNCLPCTVIHQLFEELDNIE